MIECTSCHNVHAVTPGVKFNESGTGGKFDGLGHSGEFLRAKDSRLERIYQEKTSL